MLARWREVLPLPPTASRTLQTVLRPEVALLPSFTVCGVNVGQVFVAVLKAVLLTTAPGLTCCASPAWSDGDEVAAVEQQVWR